MFLRSTTEHENGQMIPLLRGARAVRPWGGLWVRETHPGASQPLLLRDRCCFGDGILKPSPPP
jgi:hypothetical protein